MKTTTRFNEEEELVHEWLKSFFHYAGVHGEDSQTIKQAERVAFNVLRGLFGSDLSDIFKRLSRDELIKIRAVQQERIQKTKDSVGLSQFQTPPFVGQNITRRLEKIKRGD